MPEQYENNSDINMIKSRRRECSGGFFIYLNGNTENAARRGINFGKIQHESC